MIRVKVDVGCQSVDVIRSLHDGKQLAQDDDIAVVKRQQKYFVEEQLELAPDRKSKRMNSSQELVYSMTFYA